MGMSFERLKIDNKSPVYLQVVKYIKLQILSGFFKDGDELPSRRKLASILNVNPNTIQKTYKQLEEERVIITPSNANSKISLSKKSLAKMRKSLIESDIKEMILSLKEMNLSFKEVIDMISDLWDEV
ncbi:GntR family transcriptional regulator [Herbivorax sp. ANBcel31]|uniref:GntR family transcriptional regulator n=1 Tax=Herbivorax sp. ANBcel31 TaxID=3069754 RepID=UPI0027B7984C|nr:GntR family transcriptional regulator [Herbivorax sp. ANBcel31]MDQ2086929.1 GntR family transcriptional regulator [Herbivorax sp. ANBcel31]